MPVESEKGEGDGLPGEGNATTEEDLEAAMTTSRFPIVGDRPDLASEQTLLELRTRQVELELQNRELREAKISLEQSRARFEELYDFAPIAYFTFDVQGCIREVNLTGATMVGEDRARLVGLPFLSLVQMPEPAMFWQHLRRCTAERQSVVSEMRFSTRRLGARTFQVVSAPVFDASRQAIAFRTSFSDITELKRMEADLEHANQSEKLLRIQFEILDRASLEQGQALARVGAMPRGELLLQAIVDQARSIVDCEFAALGIGDDSERSFAPWVFSGLDAARAAAIGRAPRARGILGEVARTGHSLRLRDLRDHPAFGGLPEQHPEMRSFLGVPVRHAGRTVGNLYLTNKRLAGEFSEDDQRVVEMFAERSGVALEIARLADEVRAAVTARDNLLAVVSHDLRNPLSAIHLSANLLAYKGPGGDQPQQHRKQIDVILRSTERMTRLIDDLLQAATIETGKFTVEARREEVSPIVGEALQVLEPMATARSLQLRHEVPAGLPHLHGDRQRIIQVLSNLIGNAIKFTRKGGEIRVRVAAHASELRFSVSDDGPGIAADQQAQIFDRYWKGPTKPRDGVGLGLYIARGIVEAHGGRMWVESQLGGGTTFYFTIPIANPVEAVD